MGTGRSVNMTAVVLGAGLAGGNAAVTLREEGWQGRILLLGAEPGIPFGRPPLSKTYLRGEEDLSGWYVKPAEWYGSHDIDRRTEVHVRQVDTAQKQLHMASAGSVDYDRLVLCTGGRNRRFDMPGSTLQGVYQLRTVAECDAIRQAAVPGARAVVIGMGFIGSEVAASLRQLGLDVTVVLHGTAPLSGVLGDEAAAVLGLIHREHGVRFVTGDEVSSLEGNQHVERALTARGARLDCDLVIAAVGIEPALEALSGSGIALENGILVDEQCRTSVPDVVAAGDVANIAHPVFGRVRVEHFNNAEKQGRAAARTLLGNRQPFDYIYSFWSDQYEHNIEYVGFTRTWDRTILRGSYESKRFLLFYLEKERLKAVLGLNRGGDPELEPESELRACQDLIHAGGKVAEADLADERVALRSLLPE